MTTTRHHGRVRVDPYAWMADVDSPELLDYLAAENAYAVARTAHVTPLAERLYAEMLARIDESDLSVPTRFGRYWWYERVHVGDDYPVHGRVLVASPHGGAAPPVLAPDGGPPAGEQVVLDENARAAAARAAGHDFFAVGPCEVSVDDRFFAVGVDLTGDERYDVTVEQIDTGLVIDSALVGVGESLAWSHDGRWIFYTRLDEAWRPHEVWRHRVGSPADDDVLVLAEADERFFLGVGASRDDEWLVITAAAATTSQSWLIPARRPEAAPVPVADRHEGVEQRVDVLGADVLGADVLGADVLGADVLGVEGDRVEGDRVEGDRVEGERAGIVVVTHNANRADFDVSTAALADLGHWPSHLRDWPRLTVARAGESGESGESVVAADVFERALVVSLRVAGSPVLRVVPRAADGSLQASLAWDVDAGPPGRMLALEANPDPGSGTLRYATSSFVEPQRVVEVDLDTLAQRTLKERGVRGVDLDDYVQERLWATSADGTEVPVTLVHHRHTRPDATAPGLVTVYGAYGIETDPGFAVTWTSLFDRGVVVAVAHVRGGSDLGRSWYDDGRLEHKEHTIDDLLAAGRALIGSGWVAPGRLAAEGGSAGGIPVGAVANRDGDATFTMLHASVPFVDVLTSMLDESLPLTIAERDEWGDPLADVEAYDRIARYAPYENVGAHRYPALLVTASLHDTRVLVTEPAKWVARLRAVAGAVPGQAPVLLRTELDAGHQGRSGRYESWRQSAWEMAVILDAIGVSAATQAVEPGSERPPEPESEAASAATVEPPRPETNPPVP